jgi:hypothetical protein
VSFFFFLLFWEYLPLWREELESARCGGSRRARARVKRRKEKKKKKKKKKTSISLFLQFPSAFSLSFLFPFSLPLHFLLRMSAPNPTDAELEARETELFRSGPLSVLTASVKSNSQVS